MRFLPKCRWLLLLGLPMLLWGAQPDPFVRREFVFNHAPFVDCHAATIAEAPDGRLLCAWFAGSNEKNPDTGIWLSQFQDGAWSRPLEFANGLTPSGRRYSSWNPVLFCAQDGRVFFFYLLGESPRAWGGFYRVSNDNGDTWSPRHAQEIGITGPVRNPPLQLPNGRIVSPSSTEFHSTFGWRSHVELSDDNGAMWRKIKIPSDGLSTIQPTVLRHDDGRLQVICRTRSKKLAVSFSSDDGETWSPLKEIDVPNPNAGITAIRLADSRFLMVHNPGDADRSHLIVSLSQDGLTWRQALALQSDAPPNEYSYPTAIQTKDGLVHVVYTWRRSKIAHEVIDPSKL